MTHLITNFIVKLSILRRSNLGIALIIDKEICIAKNKIKQIKVWNRNCWGPSDLNRFRVVSFWCILNAYLRLMSTVSKLLAETDDIFVHLICLFYIIKTFHNAQWSSFLLWSQLAFYNSFNAFSSDNRVLFIIFIVSIV